MAVKEMQNRTTNWIFDLHVENQLACSSLNVKYFQSVEQSLIELFCLFWRMVHKSYTLNCCLEEWFINLLIHAYQCKIFLKLFHHFSFHSCCSYWILVCLRFVSQFSIFRCVPHFSIFRFVAFRFVIFRSLRFVAFCFRFLGWYNPCKINYWTQ